MVESRGEPSPDPIAEIEAAIARLRRGRGRGGPFGGPHGDPRFGPDAVGPDPDGSDAGERHPPGTPRFGGGPWGRMPHGDPRRGGHEPGAEHGHRGHGPHGRRGDFAQAARYRLLEALDRAGEPLSVSGLAAAVGVDQPRASRLVQSAVQLGQVRREADPDDARRSAIALTDEGRAVLAEARRARRGAVETALSGFTPAEREQFAALLARFVDAWPRG